MKTPHLRRSAPAALTLAALAVVIGCGGGGGGGGSSSTTATNTTASASTTSSAGTTSSATTTTTAGTPLPGNLLPNTVYYVNPTINSSDATSYEVRYVSPDGTTGGTYRATQGTDIIAVAPDPTSSGRAVFAARTGSGGYGIYRNTSLTVAGAEVVAAPSPSYAYVYSIQPSPDGTHLIFVASTNAAAPRLYESTLNTGTNAWSTVNRDQADSAALSYDGTKIVYAKELSPSNTELYLRTIGSAATPLRLTSNTVYDDDPQFSKDGSRIVFSQTTTADPNTHHLATVSVSGGAVTTADPVAGVDQLYPSLNEGASQISFVTSSGLYVADYVNGAVTNPNLVVPAVVGETGSPLGTYFTSSQGRAIGGLSLNLSFPYRH